MAFIPLKIGDLRIGLYIKLECSWWNHPFAKNKFKVTSKKEIATIKGMRKVTLFYDPELSDPEEVVTVETVAEIPESINGGPNQEELERQEEELRKEQIQACEDHTAELQKASYLYQQAIAQTKIAIKRISDGHAAGIKSADQVVSTLIHSLNSPGTSMAIIDIMTSSEAGDPFLAHALNVCIVSVLVGKEYQLDETDLYALGLAGLLHDVGKQNFPTMLRDKHFGLTKMEHQEWVKHPTLGHGVLERFPSIPEAAVLAVHQHHERLDGSGFPLGLQGDDISFFAKILMAADEYDHLCHQADHSKNLTPAEALSYLYDHYIVDKLMAVSDTINNLMNEGLVESKSVEDSSAKEEAVAAEQVSENAELSEEVVVYMVRALGVYPPGSFVELTNGAVGLVTGVSTEERTKPCVMICTPNVPRQEARVVDLAKDEIAIVHSIRPQHLPKHVQHYLLAGRS
ncbi:MAG: DUF3391 domain-containing protein [Nitrospirae bacterium]|nr:DUF3391 domain-containing protein [Nitrospirota bacterium]MDA1304535.1 DUF3391 domain-containing protein [Nitrospirota bacterium]